MNIPMKYEDVVARLEESLRREQELKRLLCGVVNESPTGFAASKNDLANRVNDALKPY